MLVKQNIREGELIAPEEGVDVYYRPSPLKTERKHVKSSAGLTLTEVMAESGIDANKNLYVTLNGHVIPRDNWHRIRVKKGVSINVLSVPGKGALRQVLAIVVSIVALVIAPMLAAPLLASFGIAAGTVAATAITGLIGAGLTIAGTLAINALFPVSNTSTQSNLSETTKNLYSIGGAKNQSGTFQPIPVVFGTHRISPPYAANPFTEIVGDDQYLRMLFCAGYGPIAMSDIRIGETPISSFDEYQIEVIENHLTTSQTLYTQPVYEEAIQIQLEQADGFSQRTTADNIDSLSVDIAFPNGIYRVQKSDGNRVNYTVTIEVQYAVAGTGVWTSAGSITITNNSQQAVRRTVYVDVTRGQYDVRVRKATPEYVGDDSVSESAFWTAIRGRRNQPVINFPKPLSIIALRIKASNELNGVVDNLNMIASARMRAFNGTTWIDNQITSNPADHFRHVLQSNANERPRTDSEIDLDSIQDWWQFCVDQGFKFDFVATEARSVYETLTMIAAAGRAAVTLQDGKWGVVYDKANTPIVQHFTPRNSWGFDSTRAYIERPHAFRMSFINKDNNYLIDERIVYDDFFDASSATRFEGLDFPGIVDPALIWRHGRYHLAQLRLQREVFSLNADFENLVCTRGDRVRVNHDVTLWGLGSARVKSTTTFPDTVTVDDTFAMEAGKTYAMRFRQPNGDTLVRTILGVDGEFSTFTLDNSGEMPYNGALVLFGEQSFESVVLRVKSITAQSDLTARIELVNDAPEILDADTGIIPDFITGIAPSADYRALSVSNVSFIESIWEVNPPSSALDLSWTPPEGVSTLSYVIQYRQTGTDIWFTETSTTNQTVLDTLAAGVYDIRIRGISGDGQFSRWFNLSANVGIFTRIPANVAGFNISVTGDNANLQWVATTEEFVSHHEIRFSPSTSGVTWQSAALLRANVAGNQIQVPALVGTYLIKAVSFSGLSSVSPTIIVNQINPLTAFNAVEEINEHPVFAGSKTDVVVIDGGLQLTSSGDIFELTDWFEPADFFSSGGGYPTEGLYEFANIVDLNEVYTSRVSSVVSAFGYYAGEDVFARPDWFGVSDFFGTASESLWDVTLEIATTVDDPDGTPTWSSWAELVASDIYARAYKFRLRLNSSQFDVTPVVTSLSALIDMPDRVIAENSLVVPSTGRRINFVPPYFNLNGVSIAAENLSTGDFYEITDKTKLGFDIVFKNSSGVGIERTFDYVAKGYGVEN